MSKLPNKAKIYFLKKGLKDPMKRLKHLHTLKERKNPYKKFPITVSMYECISILEWEISEKIFLIEPICKNTIKQYNMVVIFEEMDRPLLGECAKYSLEDKVGTSKSSVAANSRRE